MSFVRVPPDSTGKKLVTTETVDGHVQHVIAEGTASEATLQDVASALAPLATDASLAMAVSLLSSVLAELQPKYEGGPINVGNFPAVQQVSGTFYQAVQPVSATVLPLPAGASTEATLAAIKAKTDNIDVALSTRAVTGLTDTQLRASALPVSLAALPALAAGSAAIGSVSVSNLPASQPVIGPLTDTQLRAVAVPVSVSNLPATQPVSGPLTDAQLRATAVPVSGTVSVGNFPATQPVAGAFFQATQPVSGPLTDTQLRAAALQTRTDVGANSIAAGTAAGTTALGAGQRIQSVCVTTGTAAAATLQIGAGAVATVPAGTQLSLNPGGNLAAGTQVTFGGTPASWVVEVIG